MYLYMNNSNKTTTALRHRMLGANTAYRIRRNLRQEKFSPISPMPAVGEKFLSARFLSSKKIFTLRSTNTSNSDQLFFLASTSSSMSLLSYFQVAPRRDLVADRYHQSSTISEANAAVDHAAQRAKETKKRGAYIKLDEKTEIRISTYSSENGIGAAARRLSLELASSTHYFLPRAWAVGEIFVPIQSTSLW